MARPADPPRDFICPYEHNKNKGKPPALPGDSQSLTIPGL